MQLFDVYPLYDIEPVRGQGTYVYDKDGREILDFYGGHAVISIGHSHPHYVRALQEQIAKIGFYSNSIQNPLQTELADKLGALSGLDDYHLFLVSSGAEANENALKVASFHTGRSRILAFAGAFHGRTSAAVNVTDNESIKAPINRNYPVTFLPLNDLEAVERELAKGDVAAVIIEGVQGIHGIYVPEPAFLEALAGLCHANGALLILDEVQSGYGRTGKFFGFQYSAVEPDLVTVAKGMGNGFPIGGVLIHPSLPAKHGMLGTTFGGSHLACAAGIAVLDVLKSEDLITNAAEQGRYLMDTLAATGLFTEVRGHGLMIGLQMDVPIGPLRKKLLFEQNVFTGSAKDPNTIRLLPPLNVSRAECERLVEAFTAVLVPSTVG
ncbi:aminotransferase class III-fold pyridoxal phosphate-dependent enzyme [Neolewinella lacunae]|uniref:Aspartate aminotransferase family protein n=1 Tax=Neolewinella lacunae TaxID=1517758 RepID=A0A923T8P7_9BACT|nr:aminotransferase class III-fold pyridoxal phosphate-dependent enzyme [Neolewinella lacunae]MBC6994198.1 aspartate aminotransferase family protein [Neolewinella lacunae]MDN3634643.1 aminotransferase class III-fold pyridoxal phosphate-dependent enzyme [Neolewinella lacunae]